ncbi:complement component 1 Q subcomponent-binding protein, mitochondrial [Coccinella septempunctata]|uniref:complement component 1 Q subcomponent-binding protein, mitochondrial n=1 Tax=Coccinella septempunctata TaxID=41139 RepID=UPI001D083198|nr:complement component 1 Q subcomponent-binding protein, mitochondrial [Coccinella septempunctata]
MNVNHIFRVYRNSSILRTLLNSSKQLTANSNVNMRYPQITRNMWCLSGNSHAHKNSLFNHSLNCNCGCGKSNAHSKAEKELVEFLTEEILAERKTQKTTTIPSELDGFKAKLNGAEVTLVKEINDETIKITFNVNHTVDQDIEDIDPNMDKPELGELKSKPAFKVEILRGNTTLNLVCSFLSPGDDGGEYNDIFGIDEISIYEGDWNENVYAVSGEVVDSYLYDLILNYLEDKGITNEFVEKLSGYSTAFEHSAYIGLLESLSKFVSGK